MKNTVPSMSSSQSGRGSHPGGELDRLDGAVVVGTTQCSDEQIRIHEEGHTRRDSGEQPATRPAGWGVQTGARRWATDLEGALSHSAHATPSGERSMRPSGSTNPGRIGACRKATHKEPAESVSCPAQEVRLTRINP